MMFEFLPIEAQKALENHTLTLTGADEYSSFTNYYYNVDGHDRPLTIDEYGFKFNDYDIRLPLFCGEHEWIVAAKMLNILLDDYLESYREI